MDKKAGCSKKAQSWLAIKTIESWQSVPEPWVTFDHFGYMPLIYTPIDVACDGDVCGMLCFY
jgi:hypothetical protein